MMRIPTPYGAWKIDDNGDMVFRDPEIQTVLYDIYPEGYLEAYDGDENLKAKSRMGTGF